MPLDVAASPHTVTATLHYLKGGPDKPVRYVKDPPSGGTILEWHR